eukprot:gnl/MRDRNA2_/MRDRNA2_224252_c0_seq1.p1 gnl/MRDRNA2_/MRDRNA2_224252_c0~~gnl/MRDRNA2_/MRDRNA2_224252_c0_seq1.p1  ORF type:complete len:100 (+),score=10.27 gnl/MRDRNA2_/MRDRNA2_224252_c0_seq1:77-376(+)
MAVESQHSAGQISESTEAKHDKAAKCSQIHGKCLIVLVLVIFALAAFDLTWSEIMSHVAGTLQVLWLESMMTVVLFWRISKYKKPTDKPGFSNASRKIS